MLLQRQVRRVRRCLGLLSLEQPASSTLAALPTATALPYAATSDEQHSDQATDKDVRPAAEDHLLVLFLLFLGADGRALDLVWREQGPLGVGGGVVAAEADFDEVGFAVVVGGEREHLDVGVVAVFG